MALLILLSLTLFMVALWTLMCRLGLGWMGVADVKLWKVILAALIVIVISTAITSLFSIPLARLQAPEVVGLLLNAGVYGVFTLFTIGRLFHISFGRTFLVYLMTLLAPMTTLALTLLVLKPFVFEAYKVPTGAMAPSILGRHFVAECPECGAQCYGSASDYRLRSYDGTPIELICDNFHISKSPPPDLRVFSGDRILVSKTSTPKRWDIVAFRYPPEPQTIYCMRLVGLPGETITIEDGSVFADGKKLELPPHLQGLQYVNEFDIPWQKDTRLSGHPEKPAELGEDEYFVLGDNTVISSDSRLWPQTDNAHPSYAVPKDNLVGVVQEIYWPPARWRSFP